MTRTLLLAFCCAALSSTAFADEKATPAEVGKPAPDFTVTGIDGKKFKLSEKLKKGDRNFVLIFSRANW